MNEKFQLRTCIACKIVRPKDEFMRVAINKEQQAILDKTGQMKGRGAYVCNKECLKQAVERRQLSRALRTKADTSRLKTTL